MPFPPKPFRIETFDIIRRMPPLLIPREEAHIINLDDGEEDIRGLWRDG